MRLSFSMLTNYLQCPFRLSLLATNPDTLLFQAQYEGLYAHEWIERYLRLKINGEATDMSFESINKSILKESRILTFEAKPFLDEERLKQWGDWVLENLMKDVYRVETELKVEKRYKEHTISGVVDVLAFSSKGNFLIDLKRSNNVKKYDAKQTTLYSWLLSDYDVKDSYLVFLKTHGEPPVKVISFQLDCNEDLLSWMLRMLDRIGIIMDYELIEYLPPNIGDRTCHPNRCSVYYMCPYALSFPNHSEVYDEEYL